MNLEERFRKIEDGLVADKAILRRLKSEREEVIAKSKAARKERRLARKASLLVQFAGRSQRESVRKAFKKALSSALRAAFGPSYKARLRVVERRDRPEMELEVKGDGQTGDVMEQRGGGVADVVALSFRLAAVAAGRSRGAMNIVVLDEPTKHLDSSRSESVMKMMKAMAKKYGIKILFVTQQGAFDGLADRMIRI